MTSREKVSLIFDRKGTGEGAMWTGHPNDKTIPIYAEAWGIEPIREAIFTYLNDDCRWILADGGYHHPEGRPAFDPDYGTLECPPSFEGGHFYRNFSGSISSGSYITRAWFSLIRVWDSSLPVRLSTTSRQTLPQRKTASPSRVKCSSSARTW